MHRTRQAKSSTDYRRIRSISQFRQWNSKTRIFDGSLLEHSVIKQDRPLFCQRLQVIWQEQGICCQSYPTITNQILDLYKLHCLVQEKQGYLEITTNRGWKEISTVLGFGDSGKKVIDDSRYDPWDEGVPGSAAYSVKRNYVRLGLLAYECRFDRAGIDPRLVIELSEMPHTVRSLIVERCFFSKADCLV